MTNFQELIPHWSLTFHSNGLQHHGGHGLSFPKWYDTCIFVEKWPHNSPKSEELRFWSKFWQNFRGLFGALKTLFWCNQRYRWMPPYGYSRFLTSKTNFENLIFPIPYSVPYSDLQTFFSYSLREMFGQLVFLCLPQNVKIDLFYFTTSKLLYLQCCIKITYSFVIFLWNYKSCVYYRSKISSNIYWPHEVHTIFIRINCQFKMHF